MVGASVEEVVVDELVLDEGMATDAVGAVSATGVGSVVEHEVTRTSRVTKSGMMPFVATCESRGMLWCSQCDPVFIC